MSTLKIKRENGKIFCPLADSWHIETPEEKVRQEYIKILVEDYGYSLDQMAQEIKVNNSQRGQSIIVPNTCHRLHREQPGFYRVSCIARSCGYPSKSGTLMGEEEQRSD